ncbi:MAG: hypothetical protein CM1200mP22_03590 [Dehalococcoidia bacterium]|nr:MAG: hypothetical protein CM1200mP22_03590 [Dehalococcoidia bacterium]
MERVTGHRAVMSVFHDWTGRVARGEGIIAEDMDQGRDYIYITDIAEGLRCVLDAPELPHDLYKTLSTGIWLTFQQILDGVSELSPPYQGNPSYFYSTQSWRRKLLTGAVVWGTDYSVTLVGPLGVRLKIGFNRLHPMAERFWVLGLNLENFDKNQSRK